MAKISNLFIDKLYAFNKTRPIIPVEKEIIEKIFLTSFGESPNFENKIKFVDANLHNDLFKIESENNNLYLKIALKTDSENVLFKKEFSVLLENVFKNIAPVPSFYGELKDFGNINYLALGTIHCDNISDYGVYDALKNKETFVYFLNKLSAFSSNDFELESFNDHLDFYLNFDILKVPDLGYDSLEKNPIIKNLAKQQTILLQKILKDRLSKINFNQNDFCHGNLNKSTILYDGAYFKCINFENAYKGDFLFEILNLKYNLYFSESFENEIIKEFSSISKIKLNLIQLKQYKEFVCYWNLLKLCVNYLQEVFVLRCCRMDKILDLTYFFSQNYENFYQLPDFDKNFKPIAELFVESVI